MVKALVPFSGDPITFGHENIIRRVAELFDEVTVWIGQNPEKSYLFTLDERFDMARKALSHLDNVVVTSSYGLLVDYAYKQDIPVVIRGIRDSADFDYENLIREAGESQKLGIETLALFADPKLSYIRSSTVKAIQEEHGLIHELVPLYVKQKLEEKMSNQYIVGVTGELGSGKSHVGKRFEELGKERNINVYNIELDQISHNILKKFEEPRYKKIREEIACRFGDEVRAEDGKIDRKALGELVFGDQKKLDSLNEIMYTPLIVSLRDELRGKKGLVLINAALIAESDMTYLCNNNVVLVYADKESQQRRLKERNLDFEQIDRRLKSQYSYGEKKSKLESIIERDKQGKLWLIDNSDGLVGSNIYKAFEGITGELRVK